jgi:hypothetical protein
MWAVIGLHGLAHLLVVFGLILLLTVGLLALAGRIRVLRLLGRLPGDMVLRWGNTRVYVPVTTCLLLSLLLTLLLKLIGWLLP